MPDSESGLCRLCGASYRCLEEMLSSPAWEDRHTARCVMESCPGCREIFRTGLKLQSRRHKEMPIKNLSDKRRLPRLGKIHLGVRKVNEGGVEYPSAVDHFVCPDEVKAVFGDRPRELRIIIPVEDEEKWASQYYRCYSQTRGLVCKGDGETCTRIAEKDTEDIANRNSAGIEMKELPCPGTECRYYGERCKEVMNLQFLLPEVPGLGVWQIDTSSINSIKNINSAAELIKRICGRDYIVRTIKFINCSILGLII